jgi:putative transposon-encoded protein
LRGHTAEEIPLNRYCNNVAIEKMPKRKSVAKKPMRIVMDGFEVVEKIAMPCASSARILVPKHWIKKRVRAVRLDP